MMLACCSPHDMEPKTLRKLEQEFEACRRVGVRGVCVSVCMCVCMYACLYVCRCACLYVCRCRCRCVHVRVVCVSVVYSFPYVSGMFQMGVCVRAAFILAAFLVNVRVSIHSIHSRFCSSVLHLSLHLLSHFACLVLTHVHSL